MLLCSFSGPVEGRSSSLNLGTFDDTLSENGSSTLASDYIATQEDPTPSVVPSTTTKAPPPLPTLFESRPQASSGYISNEQFNPFAIDSPDLDSLPTPKLTTQDAASESGYFPMPSVLDVQSSQVKRNGSRVQVSPSPSPNKVSPASSINKLENVGRSELLSSDYVAAPAHLSPTSPSSSSTQVKNSLASTSAAVQNVAKKSRQLFAKVLPKKSSSTSSPSKGSKTESDTQQQSKQAPRQLLAPPISTSLTGELEENDDSDMGDLVDLLDLGDPVDQGVGSSPFTAANGNLSLTTSSDSHVGSSSGYFHGSSTDVGVPSSTLTSMLTPDPFSTNSQSTVSATNSGYFQSPNSGGLTNIGSTSAATTTPYQPISEDDDSDSFFLPDLPGDSDNINVSSSAGGGISYGGSIVTLSGGGQFPAFEDSKK